MTLYGIKGLTAQGTKDWAAITAKAVERFFSQPQFGIRDIAVKVKVQTVIRRKLTPTNFRRLMTNEEVIIVFDMEVIFQLDSNEIEVGELAYLWLSAASDRNAYLSDLHNSKNKNLERVRAVSEVSGTGLPEIVPSAPPSVSPAPSSTSEPSAKPSKSAEPTETYAPSASPSKSLVPSASLAPTTSLLPVTTTLENITMRLIGISNLPGGAQNAFEQETKLYIEAFVKKHPDVFVDITNFSTEVTVSTFQGHPKYNNVVATYGMVMTFDCPDTSLYTYSGKFLAQRTTFEVHFGSGFLECPPIKLNHKMGKQEPLPSDRFAY